MKKRLKELRDFRKATGMTVTQFAASENLSDRVIYQFESGECAPTLLTAVKLKRMYKLKSLDEVVDICREAMERERAA